MPPTVQPIHKPEPPQLSDDMTRADLIEVMEYLPWRDALSINV